MPKKHNKIVAALTVWECMWRDNECMQGKTTCTEIKG